ncbi:unnamed protein product [Gongylonema pulchrum]|uniref:Uncharacterized protein n=1 Tax=Gongylonema pulchrum TaxID=637853 RepID=A0A183EJF7_9BILA|nr:unnamed protein product [Gongylonema pulchrum]
MARDAEERQRTLVSFQRQRSFGCGDGNGAQQQYYRGSRGLRRLVVVAHLDGPSGRCIPNRDSFVQSVNRKSDRGAS